MPTRLLILRPEDIPSATAVRLAAPIMIVSLLLLGVGVAAAWYVLKRERDMTDLLTEDVSSVQASEELVIAASQIETLLDQYLLSGDAGHLDQVPRLWETTRDRLADADRVAGSAAERETLREIEGANERFWEEFAALRDRARREEVKREVRDLSSRELTRSIRIPAQGYLDEQKVNAAGTISENQAMPGRIAMGLLALGVCGAVAGLLAGFGIARAVRRSFAQLSVPVRDAAGKLSEVIGPVTVAPARDVKGLEGSLRKLADEVGTVVERLEQSRRETLRSEQLAALGQWAAGLAHELRNPLTSMKILVQAAAERDGEGGPGLSGRPLAVMEEEIGRMDKLLQSFLDFARPAALERRPVDLIPILEQKLVLMGPRMAMRSIAVEFEAPPGPIVVEADAGHLRQLFLNLMLNALDATEDGGRISLRVALEPDPGGSPDVVEVEVADEGAGLPPGFGDRIFEPFVSTKETGLGLGLSICRRIVEAHGGTIVAEDRPEQGARFAVRLPLGRGGGSRP